VSKSLLFLSLIGLMLFVLAIAGEERSPLATQLTGASLARTADAVDEPEANLAHPKHANVTRAPASVARTLDIEPVLPGSD
jgi:hypothetical protein